MTEWKSGIAKITLPTPFAVGDVNVFLIKGDRLTLVDVGPKTESAWEALKSQLNDLKLIPEDIEQVILTHHHPDHSGLLDFFPQSLEVYGHFLNERWINRNQSFLEEHDDFYRKLFVEFGIPEKFFSFIDIMKKSLKFSCNRSLTGTLTEGENPPGLDNWEVLETPGHAQSHIALWRKKDGILIGGDLLLTSISPNPLLEPPLPGMTERPKPQLQYNHSIKRLFDLPIERMYTGHGTDITDVHQLAEKRLERQHERAMQVKKWLEKEELTVFEICKRLFPAVYERELPLTISETIAQLDYFDSLGEIDMMKDNQTYIFKAK